MANKKGFKAVELETLTDEQLEDLVLSNWHKLNNALKAVQPLPVLRRLLMLELAKGSSARPVIAERIRSSISRVMAKKSKRGLDDALEDLLLPPKKLDYTELVVSLMNAGLESNEADFICNKIRESI
jgi:hypothetical protein